MLIWSAGPNHLCRGKSWNKKMFLAVQNHLRSWANIQSVNCIEDQKTNKCFLSHQMSSKWDKLSPMMVVCSTTFLTIKNSLLPRANKTTRGYGARGQARPLNSGSECVAVVWFNWSCNVKGYLHVRPMTLLCHGLFSAIVQRLSIEAPSPALFDVEINFH